MDCRPPGFSVHGIFQARTLEWVAISFCRGSFQPRGRTCISCIGRLILDYWAIREAVYIYSSSYYFPLWLNRILSIVPCEIQFLLLFSHPAMSGSLQPHRLWHTRTPSPSPSPGVCPSSCPVHWWCHRAISSSHSLFSSCPQSFPASRTFPVSQLFVSSDQNTGASASVPPIQGWFPLRLIGLISLQSKGLSGVFSSTTVWRHQFCLVLCLLYGPALTTLCDHRENLSLDCKDLCQQCDISAFQHTV